MVQTQIVTTQPSATMVAAGNYSGRTYVHKFGFNPATGTSFTPVAVGGVYQTPQVAAAKTLRIKAGGDANDTTAGTGARAVTLIGLTTAGAEQSVTLATAGASASAATSVSFLRLYRAYVSASGTYATSAAGSHAAAITIEAADGSADWATIYATGFPAGQTEIGAYTIPLNKTGYIENIMYSVASTKIADIALFQRQNALETAAPYTAMRLVQRFSGIVAGSGTIPLPAPLGPFPALTDIGFLGLVSATTGAMSVGFDILLIDNDVR